MNLKKILLTIGIGAFLVACSTTKITEYGTTKDTKPNITYINKTNNEILGNEELKNDVFNRTRRRVNKDLKGVWVATVFNLDFPKTKGAFSQKREIDEIVNNVKKWGFNAIFLQIKPEAGAFYNSKNLPWSKYLTGVEGVNPDYDPLEYFIEVAHKNNIELHAWINPYRISLNNTLAGASSKNIGVLHPDWVFRYNNKLYLNPSKKGVVEYLYNTIEEVVSNYDVDGIHLDDYFYPYPDPTNGVKLANFDYNQYKETGNKFSSISDFRREQVNELIKNLSVSIHKIKPNVSFGVAPFGIWRNKYNDYRGSNTSGLESYDTLYADTLKWMSEKWIDYVAPQLYWKVGRKEADYKTLVEWWNNKALETNTPLYIGEGSYKLVEEKEKWDWPINEMKKHNIIRKTNSAINGYIIYRYGILKNNNWILKDIE